MEWTALADKNGYHCLNIAAPWDEIAADYDDLVARYAATVRLPGFRPGKTPRAVTEQRCRAEILAELSARTVQRLGREAVDQVADDPSVELARALAHMAGLRMTEGTRDDALDYADRAIELAERFDDAFALSNALISKGSVVARDEPKTSVELIDRGRQIAMKAGFAITATRGWNNMALWLRFLGRSNEDRLAFVM